MLYKVGIVTEYKNGQARVYFEKDNIQTDWLQICYPFSVGNSMVYPLANNTQVHCIMDEFCEEGCIIGASYNTADATPANNNNVVMALGSGSKYQLKKGSDTLLTALTDLIGAIEPILVIYGNNPDFVKLQSAKTKLNNLLV